MDERTGGEGDDDAPTDEGSSVAGGADLAGGEPSSPDAGASPVDDGATERVDVLAYRFPLHDDREDQFWTVPAGMGERVVEAHELEAAKRRRVRAVLQWLLAAALGAGGWLLVHPLLGVGLAVAVVAIFRYAASRTEAVLPAVVATDLAPGDARSLWDAVAEPDVAALERARE